MLWQTQPEAEKLAHQGIVDPPSAISPTQIPFFHWDCPAPKWLALTWNWSHHRCCWCTFAGCGVLWISLKYICLVQSCPIILGNAEIPWNPWKSMIQFSGTSYIWVDPWLIHWDLSMPSSTSRAAGNAFRGGAGLWNGISDHAMGTTLKLHR